MLTWTLVCIHLRSAALLEELKAMARKGLIRSATAFGEAFAARYRAHPRLFEARSQFRLQGFGDQHGSARALHKVNRQSLAFQDRRAQRRIGLWQFMNGFRAESPCRS